MANIDDEIFDQISQYEEGGLAGETRQEVDRKLESDPLYQQHQKYYKIIIRAIKSYRDQSLMARIKAWHTEGISAGEIPKIDTLLKEDRRRVFGRRIWKGALISLAIAILGWGAYRYWSTASAGPIAIEEEEVPIASTGNFEQNRIPLLKFEQKGGELNLTATAERTIYIGKHDQLMPRYTLADEVLRLFFNSSGDYKFEELQWVEVSREGIITNYLWLEDHLYLLSPKTDRSVLQVLDDPKLIEIMSSR